MYYYPQTYQPPQQIVTGINWVQGEAGAKSCILPPNAIALLFDSEQQRFFIKQTDSSGMPLPLRVFPYREGTLTPQNVDSAPNDKSVDYITRAEFEQRLAAVEGGKHEPVVRTDAATAATAAE